MPSVLQRQSVLAWGWTASGVACKKAHDPHEHGTEDGGKFAEHVVEPIEFCGLVFGDEPGIVGTTEGLNAALNKTDDNGQDIKLVFFVHHGSPDGDTDVNTDGEIDGFPDTPILAEFTKQECSGESHELGNQKRFDQIIGLKPDGHPIIDGHSDNRVHTIDIKPVSQQKDENCFSMTDFSQGAEELAKTVGNDI